MILKASQILATVMVVLLSLTVPYNSTKPEWPEITQQNKPWTRWWWQGNMVNKQDITRLLEEYKNAGLGGFEITPIYGVQGYEDEHIDYLSSEWMERFEYTLKEAGRLDLGIDMATGTGWPFGGPWIHEEKDTPKYLVHKSYELGEGEQLEEPVRFVQEPLLRSASQVYASEFETPLTIENITKPVSANENLQLLAPEQIRFEKELPLITLMAYSEDGDVLDLTQYVDGDGNLNWTAPTGRWTLYALFQGWHGKLVERAAPGGEGFVIDHFSKTAIQNYLQYFEEAFAGYNVQSLRGFFNDSYEVQDAAGDGDWTEGFFDAFEKYRGYDLRNHIPALLGRSSDEENRRVLHDYRETISDLILNTFTSEWRSWAHKNSAITRNQAHGSPANILDLYAASDIPETEGRDIFRAKMASSAANVTGKQLISAEASTWLNEHFKSSLTDVKEDVDRYFLGGVNHIVYHGTAYSPSEEAWPGWLFYAAVHFNPQNSFWAHIAALNRYVARVQSFLQAGSPDNEVLLYYPVHDVWSESATRGNRLVHFSGNIDEVFEGSAFKTASERLLERGYGFDYISDRQIHSLGTNQSLLVTGDVSYKTLVIPETNYIPIETLEKIKELVGKGATVIAFQRLPRSFSGYGDVDKKTNRFNRVMDEIQFSESGTEGVMEAVIGNGRILQGEDLESLLTHAAIRRESLTDKGLEFVRRNDEEGKIYFIKNNNENMVKGWIPFNTNAESVVLFNPMSKQNGFLRTQSGTRGVTDVYLQLKPGESAILRTYSSPADNEGYYPYREMAGDQQKIEGTWKIEFLEGGPILPEPVETAQLQSWTKFRGEEVKNYSGTASYSISFSMPEGDADGWLLDLGTVEKSTRVKINGEDVGTLIGPVYEIYVDAGRLKEENLLEVEVANGMANRIAYMDREGIPWKKFHNVNFPARSAENRNEQGLFDASGWLPEDSGLMGPVTLTPVNEMD